MKNLEIEFKWDGNSAAALQKGRRAFETLAQVNHVQEVNICDTYLDHADERFSKQKIAFRLRRVNKKWEATFKTRTQIKNGKATRQEATLPLPDVDNLTQALSFLQRKKTWKKLDVQNLQPRFILKNKRRVLMLSYKACQAEAALDTFVIYVCGREVKMREIELELKGGKQKDFEELATLFTAKSDLPFSVNSKVKTAETLLALWRKND